MGQVALGTIEGGEGEEGATGIVRAGGKRTRRQGQEVNLKMQETKG